MASVPLVLTPLFPRCGEGQVSGRYVPLFSKCDARHSNECIQARGASRAARSFRLEASILAVWWSWRACFLWCCSAGSADDGHMCRGCPFGRGHTEALSLL